MCKHAKLEEYRVAIDAYQCMMNTNEHRCTVIQSLLPSKKVAFLGSYMVFDPLNEDTLEQYYKDTTEGRRVSDVSPELVSKISECKKKYMCFTMGSIMRTNNVCHHVSFVLQKTDTTLVVKVINSGLFYLSRGYGDVLVDVMTGVSNDLGLKAVFHHPHIGTAWVGINHRQPCNPQDYCRGGLIGEVYTMIDTRLGVHRESYCQTWCILMLLFEIKQMTKRNYDIAKNYFTTWSTDKKALEIKVREFAVAVVARFEKRIDFMYEYCHLSGLDQTGKFSDILIEAFQNLHPEIQRRKITI